MVRCEADRETTRMHTLEGPGRKISRSLVKATIQSTTERKTHGYDVVEIRARNFE